MEKEYIAVIDKLEGKKAAKGTPSSHESKLVLYIPITVDEPDVKLNRHAWKDLFLKAVHQALADEGIKFYSLISVYEQVMGFP